MYDKNICRYIARQIVRNFVHNQFENFVLALCNNDKNLYFNTTNFYLKNIETISGHRALRDSIIGFKDDTKETIEMKRIFRQFCC